MRLRFAPSPTGALHIGGIRTALYNYLLARQSGGTFILRIEDTDQGRYVPGAEAYIVESLQWLGLVPDEGPGFGGNFGPYRQSERKPMYRQYADQLIAAGHGYYAFDTPEALDAARQADPNFKYGAATRLQMRNSLTLPPDQVEALLSSGEPYTIRLKVPAGEKIVIQDLIRGEVVFDSDELDDKVMLKSDGMPTYHLANIVDDHLMQITHVIRGEEWLSSTAHHVLLYRFLGWENTMPSFAHLPLILKPSGKGKLSKRDGKQLGIPVFPLSWLGESEEDSFAGFREFGFEPKAVLNFLALLGWNPGTEQEVFSIEELTKAFSLEKIGKSGARFDFDKAKWFNQQYIQSMPVDALAARVRPLIAEKGHQPADAYLQGFCNLMKDRVTLYPDFWEKGYYCFEPVQSYDLSAVQKKWQPARKTLFIQLADRLLGAPAFHAASLDAEVHAFMSDYQLKPGDVLPILRLALAGTMQGPAVFELMELLGPEVVKNRLYNAFEVFDAAIVQA